MGPKCYHQGLERNQDGTLVSKPILIGFEVLEWLLDNMKPEVVSLDPIKVAPRYMVKSGLYGEPIYVWFRYPEDAFAFRLRWD